MYTKLLAKIQSQLVCSQFTAFSGSGSLILLSFDIAGVANGVGLGRIVGCCDSHLQLFPLLPCNHRLAILVDDLRLRILLFSISSMNPECRSGELLQRKPATAFRVGKT